MTKEKQFILLVIFVVGILLTLPYASMADEHLTVPTTFQERSNWCWAGTSQAILSYYNVDAQQCDMANLAFSRSDCCYNTEFYQNSACNHANYHYGPPTSVSNILAQYGVINLPWPYAISQSDAVYNLDMGKPFIIQFDWLPRTSTSGAHSLVVDGYANGGQYLDYIDPWPGYGPQSSLYSWVVSASNHVWSNTVTVVTNSGPYPATLSSATYNLNHGNHCLGIWRTEEAFTYCDGDLIPYYVSPAFFRTGVTVGSHCYGTWVGDESGNYCNGQLLPYYVAVDPFPGSVTIGNYCKGFWVSQESGDACNGTMEPYFVSTVPNVNVNLDTCLAGGVLSGTTCYR